MTHDPDDPERHYQGNRPPQDVAAERALLGAMMQTPEAIADAVEIVRGADFWQPAHEHLYDVIVDMFGQGLAVDWVTLIDEVRERGLLGKVGGDLAIHGLNEAVPLAVNAAYYAEIVRKKATLRRLADAGSRINQMAMSEDADADLIVDKAEATLYAATPQRASEDYVVVSEIVESTLDEIEALGNRPDGVHGVPTGFLDLDDLMGGLHPGQMITVAGRPGSGKSTLGMDFCRSASVRHNLTSALFSLEMSRSEIVMRLLSAEGRVPLNNIRHGKMGDHDWAKIAQAMPQVSSAPFFIDDSANLTMTEIRAKARRLRQHHDLRLIVIDYLQLMTSGKKVENRQVEVSEFSRQIKLLAKELQVPVVALSQLNRGPEQRSDKRPMVSDLRESGSIEQDSDVVILVHRDDMYEAESTRPGEADLIVAKHRNGPTRDITVAFQGHYSRFADLARM